MSSPRKPRGYNICLITFTLTTQHRSSKGKQKQEAMISRSGSEHEASDEQPLEDENR
jgi:hypothetical protein